MLKLKILLKHIFELAIPLVFLIVLYSSYNSWNRQITIWEAMIFGLVIGLVVNGLIGIISELLISKNIEFPVSILDKDENLKQYIPNCWVEFTRSKLRTKWFLIKTNVAITNIRLIIAGSRGKVNYRFGKGARIYDLSYVTIEQIEKTKDSYIQIDVPEVGRYKVYVNL